MQGDMTKLKTSEFRCLSKTRLALFGVLYAILVRLRGCFYGIRLGASIRIQAPRQGVCPPCPQNALWVRGQCLRYLFGGALPDTR